MLRLLYSDSIRSDITPEALKRDLRAKPYYLSRKSFKAFTVTNGVFLPHTKDDHMARVSIEDCQKKLSNRFALAMTAAHRARQLLNNAEPLVDAKNREAVLALREIAEGLVTMKVEEKVEQPEENAEDNQEKEEASTAEASAQDSESETSSGDNEGKSQSESGGESAED